MSVTDGWGQMTIYLDHGQKKNVIFSVGTSAVVMIDTSIEYGKDCFEGQIVKTWKPKILGVVDQWDKTIIILDHMWHKKL